MSLDNGIRVAFVSATAVVPGGFAAGSTRAGVADARGAVRECWRQCEQRRLAMTWLWSVCIGASSDERALTRPTRSSASSWRGSESNIGSSPPCFAAD